MLPGVDLRELLEAVGYLGLFAIVFAESGLLIGFFLPGDSLLFTAGLLASDAFGFFDIRLLLPLVAVAAIGGDQVGYLFGRRVGPRLFRREDSLFFHKKHLERAHAFYEKHGGKTIILARFLPIVRTFAPIVAGMGTMNYGQFVLYNVVGGLLWTISMIGGGYFFGSLLDPEHVDRYLLPVIVLIVAFSIAPTAWHLYKENRETVHRIVRERKLPEGWRRGDSNP
jgi:membrane-associated protein